MCFCTVADEENDILVSATAALDVIAGIASQGFQELSVSVDDERAGGCLVCIAIRSTAC